LIAKSFNGSHMPAIFLPHDVDITIRRKVEGRRRHKRMSSDDVAVDGVKGVCGGKTGIKYPAGISAKLGRESMMHPPVHGRPVKFERVHPGIAKSTANL
jgi:hypothetical protein